MFLTFRWWFCCTWPAGFDVRLGSSASDTPPCVLAQKVELQHNVSHTPEK